MSMWCDPPGLSGGFYFLDHMSLKKLFLRLFRIVSRFCDLKAALNFDQHE